MAKLIRDTKKKSRPGRGRPKTTGPGRAMVVRMHDRQLVAIDDWIARQGELLSRPEAIRRLTDLGLESVRQVGRRIRK
jgi:hypothetical protein